MWVTGADFKDEWLCYAFVTNDYLDSTLIFIVKKNVPPNRYQYESLWLILPWLWGLRAYILPWAVGIHAFWLSIPALSQPTYNQILRVRNRSAQFTLAREVVWSHTSTTGGLNPTYRSDLCWILQILTMFMQVSLCSPDACD